MNSQSQETKNLLFLVNSVVICIIFLVVPFVFSGFNLLLTFFLYGCFAITAFVTWQKRKEKMTIGPPTWQIFAIFNLLGLFYLLQVIVLKPLWLAQLAVNLPYFLVLFLTFSVPSFLVREIIWQELEPPFWYWLLAFNLFGIYFANFKDPNLLNLFWDFIFALLKNKKLFLSWGKILQLISGSLAWLGFVISSFYLAKTLFPNNGKFNRYFMAYLLYLFYLNLAILVINPRFGRDW